MKTLNFDLQRFAIVPTLLTGEDGGGVRYYNTIPGAEIVGFGSTFFVNHGAGCVIQCSNVNSHVYNDAVAPNVVINGAGGNDFLINDGVGVKINGGAGSDTIANHGPASSVMINGGSGNDSIVIEDCNYVSINAGANDDTVSTWLGSSNLKINLGTGNDKVYNNGNYVSISATADDKADEVENYGDNITMEMGGGDDYLNISGSYVTISAGDGDNKIYKWGGSVASISTGSGKDEITNSDSKVTIETGSGDDTVYNHDGSKNSSINTGEGDDVIVNCTEDNTIEAGQDKDYVENHGSNVVIFGGKGNDWITNDSSSVTIDCGADDDTVINDAGISNVTIVGDSGNDSIKNSAREVLIRGDKKNTKAVDGESYNDTIENEGSNVTIDAGLGDDEIKNIGMKVSISAGAGDDTISNIIPDYAITSGTDVTINGGNDNDLIRNNASFVYIKGGSDKGRDTVENDGNYSTIATGDGDDQISNSGSNVIIDAGKGNDAIELNGGNLIRIDAGTGDDTVTVAEGYKGQYVFSYSLGDGHDVINNVEGSNGLVINLVGGAQVDEVIQDGSSMTFKIGTGSIRINNFSEVNFVKSNDEDGQDLLGSDDNDLMCNSPEIDLNALREALYEPTDTVLNKFMEDCETDPFLKSVIEKGADSEYLADYDRATAEEIADILQKSKALAQAQKLLEETATATKKDYGEFWANELGIITGWFGNIDSAIVLVSKAGTSGARTPANLVMAGLGIAVATSAYEESAKDFNKKYPHASKDAWEEVGGFEFQDLLYPVELYNKNVDVAAIIRANDTNAYDRTILKGYDLAGSFANASVAVATPVFAFLAEEIAVSLGIVATGTAATALGLTVGAGIGLGLATVAHAAFSFGKANYLRKTRPDEYTFGQAFWEQFLGVGMGGAFESTGWGKNETVD